MTELDVAQARSLLKDTEASVPRLEASIRQSRNALATLLGKLPGEVDSMIGESGPIPNPPPTGRGGCGTPCGTAAEAS
ncbi:MAG: hypothetical protein JRJ82_19890 [Deltaproteobacteria bacterium]|nr:hypothetical protein [Deltaproteobacteria bacterium]